MTTCNAFWMVIVNQYGQTKHFMFKWLSPLLFILLVLNANSSFGQCPITSLGQNPGTAFPVCGTNNFVQASVNLCGGKTIPNPNCNTVALTDINPYWYKFTCFESGTLGFTIQPNSNISDYDWQVFDITGRDPNDVYADKSLSVSSNWSQYFGNTGTTASAANLFECEGPVPQYSKMPNLIKGHDYLLLVSHFTASQAGYKLTFGGGTASITDTTQPGLIKMEVSCDGTSLGLKLNKRMKCSSLAADGSDFRIFPAFANITAASSANCSGGFDMDSIILKIDNPLPAGKYSIYAKKGTDGNSLFDYCDHSLPEDDSVSVMVIPVQPTPMDSIQPVLCKPGTLSLVFSSTISCNSISPNGSDFSISGPSPVNISGATGSCTAGFTRLINVQLSTPIEVGGIYTITLKKGTDGNTLVNECSKETPAGTALSFRAYDTVSAAIHYSISSNCEMDTLRLTNEGRVGVNYWKWSFDDGSTNLNRNAVRIYTSGNRTIALKVSNGTCEDSSSVSIAFDKNRVKAAFKGPDFVCPLDTALFVDESTGPVSSWAWEFGNGNSSTFKDPGYQFYPWEITLKQYTARLVIASANGCKDSASKLIQVPGNCYIAVPSAFTPNGDGLNDYLYPLNAYKATHLDFRVYNRFGQLVWSTRDWTRKWDGRINGNLQASGIYVWHLTYTDVEKGKKIDIKGTTSLVR